MGLTYFGAGVHYGRMVSSAEMSAYFLKAVFCQVPGEVHTYLSGFGDTLMTFFALQVTESDIEMPGDGIDDIAYGYVPGDGIDVPFESVVRQFECYVTAGGAGNGIKSCKGAFEFADICLDFSSD
ncbi:unnamed protein product, partial [marine sediment metagenome]